MNEKENKNLFQDTLNLPQTDFSLRANASEKEPALLARWEAEGVAQAATIKNKGKKKFILHFGPPYANGHLHLGHALSYILKDIICKYKRMTGHYTPLVPGWDCHGLPIELKVTSELGIENKRDTVDRVEFKKSCRDYANKWIKVQAQELKEQGLLLDYAKPYITMDASYEASILRGLATFVEKGYIERKGKTVPWCSSCQTVLATAEIEYKDRKDPSCYILFPLEIEAAKLVFPFSFEKNPDISINFLVWTTTPWTIPLNRAVVLNPSATYVLLQGKEPNQAFIVAKELADKVCAQAGIEKIVLAECDSIVFQSKRAQHPIIEDLTVPVLLDDSVLLSDGTACVHSAPGCGPEDYLLGLRNGLEIFSPLSSDGKYTVGIKPEELVGMPVVDGQIWVIKKLAASGRLFHKASLNHSYPHCWRCRNGLMFRATDQWFCDLQKHDLVKRALSEIEKIEFVPSWGQARLHAFISNRTEWCISRQRQWGVPIPALLCKACGWAFVGSDFIHKVADKVAQHGIEYWDTATITSLIKDGILHEGFACGSCGNTNLNDFDIERDILDVWFDSGMSHDAVLYRDKERLGFPADMYLEGSDQHRGWFQSSLLCSMVVHDQAPMRTILTHGFIVDENKHKMSKSLGNTVAPNEIMQKYSRDILRLWVASADYEGDIVISEKLLQNVAEIYRKIRNTCRFLLSNLYDFDITKDAVHVDQMMALDRYALAQVSSVYEKVMQSYEKYHLTGVVHSINNYCTKDLSAVYLDILKDRLYVEKADSLQRRSAQTVMYHILHTLTQLMAPILSFTAEDLSDHYQKGAKTSIHLQDMAAPQADWLMLEATSKQWALLEEMRDAVLKMIEVQREQGVVKHSLEAQVTMFIDPASEQHKTLQAFLSRLKEDSNRFFIDWFIVSQVAFAQSATGLEQSAAPWLSGLVQHAAGVKCPRCWHWNETQHEKQLCQRCENVVGK